MGAETVERAIDEVAVRWQVLTDLPGAMLDQQDEITAIADYACRWVAQRAGFEPSPLCLLGPLAEVMDLVADGFVGLRRTAEQDWAELVRGVRETQADLCAVDRTVAGRFPEVA